MKKIALAVLAMAALTCGFTSCSKDQKKHKTLKDASLEEVLAQNYSIGIAKIVQHEALDAIEQGIKDRLTEKGIKAEYNLQNANGNPATAAQIAQVYKTQNVDLSVGIATPVALALANAITETPVIFSCVTDPVSAGLVDDTSKGKNNITGLSDYIPTEAQIKQFKEVAGIKTLGYVYSSNEANSVSSLELVKKGCQEAGLELIVQSVSKSSEVKQACEAIVSRVDGIYLTTDNTVFSALSSLVEVFNKAKKPIYSGDVTGAKKGGIFMASGFNYYKAGLATGDMIYDILVNGTAPADIPVKFITNPEDSDLLFDLDQAAICGINIPEDLMQKANMIFQNGKLEEK